MAWSRVTCSIGFLQNGARTGPNDLTWPYCSLEPLQSSVDMKALKASATTSVDGIELSFCVASRLATVCKKRGGATSQPPGASAESS